MTQDGSGRQAIDGVALARFAQESAAAADRPVPRPVVSESARKPVSRAGHHAQVEGQPSALVDLTPASVADLQLRPGLPVWLSAKATEVDVYLDHPVTRTIVAASGPTPSS